MADLKIQTGSGVVVPGQDTAEQQQAEQREQAEYDATLIYQPGISHPIDTGPDYTYSRIRIRRKDEVNIYADEQDKRYATDPRLRKIIVAAVIMVVVFFIACVMPTYFLSPERGTMNLAIFLQELVQDIQNFIGVFVDPNTMYTTYFLSILVSMFAGAAMALSGGIFQGTLKNALASPSTLGVTSGGNLGAIIFAIFIYPTSLTVNFTGSSSELMEIYNNMSWWDLMIDTYGSFLCSLLGCCAVVTIVMGISLIAGRGKISNVSLILAGQVIVQFVQLLLSWMRMWLSNHGDSEAATWLAQSQSTSFTGTYTIETVPIFIVPLLICMIICFAMSSRMSLLAFNDEEARSMGISTSRMRNGMVAVCTIMTALVISFCGNVGFVGLIIPYIARQLVGPDFRYLLPTCAIVGGIFVTAVYCICATGFIYLTTNSTGVVTSVIGSVFFLFLALRGRRSGGGEWL